VLGKGGQELFRRLKIFQHKSKKEQLLRENGEAGNVRLKVESREEIGKETTRKWEFRS